MSPTGTKIRLYICFSRLGKTVTKVCFSKGGILWRFVIKVCLIKRSTEVIRTQWQNFLQDPRKMFALCAWIHLVLFRHFNNRGKVCIFRVFSCATHIPKAVYGKKEQTKTRKYIKSLLNKRLLWKNSFPFRVDPFKKGGRILSKSCQTLLWVLCITKTRLYNFDPLKPHFYIVKLGFTGVYIICLIFAWKHRLWVLVRTASARRF